MSLYDKIIELFEEEVNQRIVSIMNEYVTIISKKHGISLDLLLKDIQVLQNNQFGIQNRTTTTENEQSFVELFGWRGNRS